jgi:transposase
MMGHQPTPQPKLFYERIQLDQRIRNDHVLRGIAQHIDFDFIYHDVRDNYGANGNVSVPPPVILKLMLLLILYNVRSERELMATVPERLDWLWFLGFDLDDEIPNHSVLSKARTRWGSEAFKGFFERIVRQCVEAGLVDGRKLFMDSCLVKANASNNSSWTGATASCSSGSMSPSRRMPSTAPTSPPPIRMPPAFAGAAATPRFSTRSIVRWMSAASSSRPPK